MKRISSVLLAMLALLGVGVGTAEARGTSYTTYVMGYPNGDSCAAVFTGTQNKAESVADKYERDGYTTYVYPWDQIPPC